MKSALLLSLLAISWLSTSPAFGALPNGWSLYPEPTVALSGSRVSFKCKISASGTFILRVGQPNSDVFVRSDGTYLLENSADKTVTVTIRNFNRTIEGDYFCVGIHADSSSNDLNGPKVRFSVAVIPTSIAPQKPVIFAENTAANVSCTFVGVPAPNITIYRAGTLLADSAGPAKSLAYPIASARRSDAGNYRCVALNMAGRGENVVEIVVEYKPTITTPIGTKRVSNGSRVYFACAADALPAPNYSWLHNGTAIQSGTRYPNGTLSIVVSSLNDTGKYACIAENSRGKDQRVFDLVVKVPPGPPGKPVATEIGINDVTLNWAPGFDGHGIVTEYKVQQLVAVSGSSKWEQYAGGKGVQGPPTRLTGLDPNQRYYFKLKAVNEVGKGNFGPSSDEIITHPLVPPPAEEVDIDNVEPTQFTVYWKAPLGFQPDRHGTIRHYTVRYYPSADGIPAAKYRNTTDGTTKTMKLNGLAKGTEYTVAVAASNRIFTGSYSTPTAQTTETTLPDAVTGLRAEPVTDQIVQLFWAFPDDLGGLPVTQIDVDYKESSSTDWIPAPNQPKMTETKATVDGLTEKKTYVFRVVIRNAKGESRPATSASVTTPANEAPSQPSLSAESAQVLQITLVWVDKGAHEADLWRIEMREPPSVSWVIARDRIEGSSETFTVDGLSPNTTYFFRLRGTNKAGNGPWSSMVEVATLAQQKPEAVDLIRVVPTLDGATVSWNGAVASDADSLTLHWMMVVGEEKYGKVLDVEVDEYVLDELESNTTYLVWLVTEANGLKSESLRHNFTTLADNTVGEVDESKGGLTTGIIIAIGAVGGGILIFILVVCLCCCCSRKQDKYTMSSDDRPSSWIEGPVDSTGWYRSQHQDDALGNDYSSFGATDRSKDDPMNSITLPYVELQFTAPNHRPPRIQPPRREDTPYAEIDYEETGRQSRSRSAEPEIPIATLDLDFSELAVHPQRRASPPPAFEPVSSPTFESDV